MSGLIGAAIIVRRDMELASPSIPRDTGNLRASVYITTSKEVQDGLSPAFKGKNKSKLGQNHSTIMSQQKNKLLLKKNPVVAIGFTAYYAIFVHENLDVNFKPTLSGGMPGPKFFKKALVRNRKAMLEVIRRRAMIK
jgi:hypothetical protein